MYPSDNDPRYSPDQEDFPWLPEKDRSNTAGPSGRLPPPSQSHSRPADPQRRGYGQQGDDSQQGFPPGQTGWPDYPPRRQPHTGGQYQPPPQGYPTAGQAGYEQNWYPQDGASQRGDGAQYGQRAPNRPNPDDYGSFNQNRSGQSGSSVPASWMRSPLHGASAGYGPGARQYDSPYYRQEQGFEVAGPGLERSLLRRERAS